MEQRKQFIIAASAEDANISGLCREFGISRKTGHKWINRAEQRLPLCDQSRRPHRQPSKTADEVEFSARAILSPLREVSATYANSFGLTTL